MSMCVNISWSAVVSQLWVSVCYRSLFTQEADYSGRTGVPHAIEITTGANTTHSVTQSLLLCAPRRLRFPLSLSVAPKASSCVSRDCTFSKFLSREGAELHSAIIALFPYANHYETRNLYRYRKSFVSYLHDMWPSVMHFVSCLFQTAEFIVK